jgi:hypothetical protein
MNRESMMSSAGAIPPNLPEKMPIRTREVETAFTAVYNWTYGGELDKIRTLYAKALDQQWHALRDLDWESELDLSRSVASFTVDGVPVHRSTFWKELNPAMKAEIQKRLFAHTLSNILHGEQGALMIAAQLVNAAPDMDSKLFAATQTLDEARHVEVFSTYLKRFDKIHKITPGLGEVLDDVTGTPSWLHKMVGMQVVIEGMALSYFRSVRFESQDPMLRQILHLVSKDEARHVAFGIRYLQSILHTISPAARIEAEDFAFEAVRRLKDPTVERSIRHRLFQLWEFIGLDPEETWSRIWAEFAQQGAMEPENDPVRDLVIPTLRKIGLLSPRIEAAFDQLFQLDQPGSRSIRGDRQEPPQDMHAWVVGEED